MSISSTAFIVFLLLSFGLTISYFVGHKKNLRVIESVSKCLEKALRPSDKEYTWLGGVLGFTGHFVLEDFKKVTASVFMLPRQSVLYFPFSYISTGYDRLEVMFYLKEKISNEMHVIRQVKPQYRMPSIYEKETLKSESVFFNGKAFLIMYRNRTREVSELITLGQNLESLGLMHIAVTPGKGIFYVKLKIILSDTEKIAQALEKCISFLQVWEKNQSDVGKRKKRAKT